MIRINGSVLLAGVFALALAGWLVSGQLRQDAPEPAPALASASPEAERPFAVTVRTVEAAPIQRVVVINGSTAPLRKVQISAEAEGRIVAVPIDKGAVVETDAVLAEIDAGAMAAALRMAEAAVEQALIEVEAARKLGERGFSARTSVAAAEAAYQKALAERETIQVNLRDTVVRAPFAGVLDRRPVEIGDYVAEGDAIATLIEQDRFLVTGEVSENDVINLKAGMPGRATLVDGRRVEGVLRYVAAEADADTRTFEVEMLVENPDARFIAGATAEMIVPFAESMTHKISAGLLSLDDDGRLGVKAVDGDDIVRFHAADIVRAEADAVYLAGLPQSLRLITIGQGFVRAGDRVTPVAAADDADDSAADGAARLASSGA